MTPESDTSGGSPAPGPEQHPLDLDSLAPILFTPARTLDELKGAFTLVHNSYVDRGYIDQAEQSLRFGIHNLLPETTTFVALLADTVIATVTLVVDSPLGLPMEVIYHDEVTALRKHGRRLGEVTMLADRRRQFLRTLPMVLALFRTLMDYAIDVPHLDDLCITLNPRHAHFYRRFLNFADIGTLKSYPSVRDNPALAMRFPLETLPALLTENPRYRGAYESTSSITRASFEDRIHLTPQTLDLLIGLLPDPHELTPDANRYLTNCYASGPPHDPQQAP